MPFSDSSSSSSEEAFPKRLDALERGAKAESSDESRSPKKGDESSSEEEQPALTTAKAKQRPSILKKLFATHKPWNNLPRQSDPIVLSSDSEEEVARLSENSENDSEDSSSGDLSPTTRQRKKDSQDDFMKALSRRLKKERRALKEAKASAEKNKDRHIEISDLKELLLYLHCDLNDGTQALKPHLEPIEDSSYFGGGDEEDDADDEDEEDDLDDEGVRKIKKKKHSFPWYIQSRRTGKFYPAAKLAQRKKRLLSSSFSSLSGAHHKQHKQKDNLAFGSSFSERLRLAEGDGIIIIREALQCRDVASTLAMDLSCI